MIIFNFRHITHSYVIRCYNKCYNIKWGFYIGKLHQCSDYYFRSDNLFCDCCHLMNEKKRIYFVEFLQFLGNPINLFDFYHIHYLNYKNIECEIIEGIIHTDDCKSGISQLQHINTTPEMYINTLVEHTIVECHWILIKLYYQTFG